LTLKLSKGEFMENYNDQVIAILFEEIEKAILGLNSAKTIQEKIEYATLVEKLTQTFQNLSVASSNFLDYEDDDYFDDVD
jgi:hypothetical protein